MKYSNSEFPFKQTGKTAIEAIKGVDTQNMSKEEREKYLAKLREDYQDLTGDKKFKFPHQKFKLSDFI